MTDIELQYPIILTKSIKKFRRWLKILVNLEQTTMFTVIGKSGIGKTTAIQYHMDRMATYSGQASHLSVVVPPTPTELTFMRECLTALGENPGRKSADECARRIISLLKDPNLKLLIVDEGDRLNTRTFDRLRDIHDKTRCPVAIVGLPKIMSILRHYPQFDSRVAAPIEFHEMTQSDIVKEFLPQLPFSHWKFDPDNAEHAALGERLWELTTPSLRNLVNLVQIANAIAAMDEDDCVAHNHVDEAIELMKLQNKRNAEQIAEELRQMEEGYFEMVSNVRNAGKKKKKD